MIGVAALSIFMGGVPRARGDSGSATTISAGDDALSRSASPSSLTPAMPTSPPAYSNAGMPTPMPDGSPAAAPTAAPAAAPEAVSSPAAISPPVNPVAPDGSVLIMDAKNAPGKLISDHDKGQYAAPGNALLVDQRGQRLEVIVNKSAPAPMPVAAQMRAPASAPAAADLSGPENSPRRRKLWLFLSAAGAAAFIFGFARRRRRSQS